MKRRVLFIIEPVYEVNQGTMFYFMPKTRDKAAFLMLLWQRLAMGHAAFFAFMTTPTKPETHELTVSERWFGLKAYVDSDVLVVKVLGWIAVASLVSGLIIAICLIVSRLYTLWDLWFEEIRRRDEEGSSSKIFRVLSFWLFVAGIVAWIGCFVITT